MNNSDLGCVCIISSYISSYDDTCPEFYSESIVKARKEHVCGECGSTIAVGEKYEYVAGKWDGCMETFKTCNTCVNIRNDYFCDYVFGRMREDLMEHLGFDYVTGESAYDNDGDEEKI